MNSDPENINHAAVIIKPIGILHTPYRDVNDNVPIQGRMLPETAGHIELFPEFVEGCRDLEGFSHITLIYYFHKCSKEKLVTMPYMDSEERGIFSTRSPHRPNHLGMTIVELLRKERNILTIKGVDMVDGTPLIDIKPFNPVIDTIDVHSSIRSGWMEKYTSGREKPGILRTGSHSEWLNEKK